MPFPTPATRATSSMDTAPGSVGVVEQLTGRGQDGLAVARGVGAFGHDTSLHKRTIQSV